MLSHEASSRSYSVGSSDHGGRWLPWLVAAVSLLPLVFCWKLFAGMFWYGDDFDMLDQIDAHGFGPWLLMPFGENFVPVFKSIWGAASLVSGSYFAVIILVWANHALNAALFASFLLRAGLSRFASVLAALVFGLAAANYETLCWTVQWSPVLSLSFFLLAAHWARARLFEAESANWRDRGVLLLLLGCSAFSFSRGVVCCFALAFFALLPPSCGQGQRCLVRRCADAALCLLPGLLALSAMLCLTQGNHRHLGAAPLGEMVRYALYYFSLNPLWRLFEVDSWGPFTVSLLGAFKLALFSWGLAAAKGRLRGLFLLLVVFDLGNSAVVGFGRYQFGVNTSVSSRYQIFSEVAFLPFACFALQVFLARALGGMPRLRRVVAAALLVLCAGAVARNWAWNAGVWKKESADKTRSLLNGTPSPSASETIPGIDSMSAARARELLDKRRLR